MYCLYSNAFSTIVSSNKYSVHLKILQWLPVMERVWLQPGYQALKSVTAYISYPPIAVLMSSAVEECSGMATIIRNIYLYFFRSRLWIDASSHVERFVH